MEKMGGTSMNVELDNIEKLKELFPNAVTEGKIDFDVLRTMLGDEVDTSKEKYQFTWNGKAESIRLAQSPSSATLRPCKEKSKDWDTTKNLYIEGDNLEVLKQLQKTYFGKIKMIYIDPPYNTGNDFVYKDDFRDSVKNYIEQSGQALSSNPETSGRFHSDWLNMMYPRLILARNLLSNEGVIFISIDEKESGNLRKICDEIFGENNFVSNLIWQSRTSISNDYEISLNHNHTLIYSKSRSMLIFGGNEIDSSEYINPDNDPRGPWKLVPIDANHAGGDTVYPVRNPKTGVDYYPPNGRIWSYNRTTMEELIKDNRIKFGLNDESSPKRKLFLNERIEKGDKKTPSSLLLDAGTTKDGTTEIMELFEGKKVFDYPKPVSLIKRLIQYGAPHGGLIMDFFSGSGTTAHALMELSAETGNDYSYILVQLPEQLDYSYENASSSSKTALKTAIEFLDSIKRNHNLTELAEERISRAGEQVKDSWNKKAEDGLLADSKDFSVDIGFKVFRLDSTNINPWDNTIEYDENELIKYNNVFKDGRTKEDILYEIMLKYGLFDQPVSEIDINEKTMYRVGQRHMIICLENKVDDKDIEEICKLEPKVVIFKEDGFEDENAKINAEYNLKKAGVEDVKCI